MDFGFAGKTVIVTGGGSNIGRAIVLAFAREGAKVVIAEIDQKQGERVAKEAEALAGEGQCLLAVCDVTKYDEVQKMVQQTLQEWGRIDVLVNNVGWDEPHLFVETTADFWNRVIALNFLSTVHCSHAALPAMIQQKAGSIVSISSDAGRIGEFRESIYGGCKAGVIALTKTIARENGRYGIRANVVCPGTTVPASPEDVGERSMWRVPPLTLEQLQKSTQSYPLRKLGKPEDVAYAVLFLASDVAAGNITGQTLSVSGGYTML